MLTLVLITLGVLALWAIHVYTWPFKTCRRCGGTGRKPTRRPGFLACRRCHGTGLTQRLGSRTAHRTVLSLGAEMSRRRHR